MSRVDIDKLVALASAASPAPWTADVDDPRTNPAWTGKFYVGDDGDTWCTYDNDTREIANVRLMEYLRNNADAIVDEMRELRARIHDADVARVDRDQAVEEAVRWRKLAADYAQAWDAHDAALLEHDDRRGLSDAAKVHISALAHARREAHARLLDAGRPEVANDVARQVLALCPVKAMST